MADDRTKEDILTNATRIVAGVIKSSGSEIRFQLPLQVWDGGDDMYGVAMEADIDMMGQPCVAKVSFTLRMSYTDEQIGEKAMTAVDAIELRVLCKIEAKKSG